MKNKSFTLIELMLVIVIIGILTAMVMPRLVGRSEESRIVAAKADINANIALALDLFETDIGHYPDTLDELMQQGNNAEWKGPYLKRKPIDPWKRPYKYERLSDVDKDYRLCSEGPSTKNSEDDICNDASE